MAPSSASNRCRSCQTWVHHAQPFVVAAEVFAFLAYYFAKPPFQFRIVDIVVIDPVFIAGIVRRINVNALDTAFVIGQQRFQRFQIIAVNNSVTGIGEGVP